MIKKQEVIFSDKDKNGKDRQWQRRKLENIQFGNRLEELKYKQFRNVYQCAEVLKFKIQEDGHLKLYQTWFCKNKLCNICNWRRSIKHSYQASLIVDEAIKEYSKGRFLFLTLTVKNVSADNLNNELSKLTKSFKRLIERKKVSKNLIGFMRATEVTRNKQTGLYHPHLHVLLFVKSSYFNNSINYISQEEWCLMWQQSAKLDYKPIVDVRAVKPNERKGKNKNDLKGAVLETAKYPVKSIEVMADTEKEKIKITGELFEGLYRKRQLSYGGIFKEIKKKLELDDVENGDLIQVSDEEKETETVNEVVAFWCWEIQNYLILADE